MQPKDWDRISEDYYHEILSPIKDAVSNPLFEDIKKLNGAVVDLGCGPGALLSRLSRQFDSVVAVDYSEGMLARAIEENPKLDNVSYKIADLNKLDGLGKFDVAISSNSILAADKKKIQKILAGIFGSLKKSGVFLGIVPSTEVYIYQAKLAQEKKGTAKAKTLLKEHDLLSGTYTFDGDTQKSFYRFEILHLLEEAGFKNVTLGKVNYPWKEFKRAGQEYYPSEALPWDWYFRCEK